jgi:hypothetical protein
MVVLKIIFYFSNTETAGVLACNSNFITVMDTEFSVPTSHGAITFLGAFLVTREKRLLASVVCPSVRPSAHISSRTTAQIVLTFGIGNLTKIYRENPELFKIEQAYGALYVKI